MCVESCPTENWFFNPASPQIDSDETRSKLVCQDGVNPFDKTASVSDLVTNDKCAYYYVKSKPCKSNFFYSVCVSMLISVFKVTYYPAVTGAYGSYV